MIIGANGYIGRNLSYYIRQKYRNFQLKLYGKEDKHFDIKKDYYQVDMLDPKSVMDLDLNCDCVYMLAGKTGAVASLKEPASFIESNEKSLILLLKEYIRQRSKAKIIFPSTRLLYKDATKADEQDVSDTFQSVYAINKFACEKYLELFHSIYGVKYTALRISIPYGTMVKGASSYGTVNFMNTAAKVQGKINIYGDGSVKRTFTHIADICKIMLECGIREDCVNTVYNIGGETFSLGYVARLIADKYNADVSYVPFPEMAYKTESGDTVLNDDKLRKEMNITYQYKFANWIAREEAYV